MKGNCVKPIRLGNEYVFPLLPDHDEAIGLPDCPTILNLSDVLASAGLDADAAAYLQLIEVDNIPRCDAHEALGWTRAKVDRVAKTIAAKRRAGLTPTVQTRFGGGSSLRPTYRQELAGGHRPYAHSEIVLSPEFVQVVSTVSNSLITSEIPPFCCLGDLSRRRLVIMVRKLREVESDHRLQRLKLAEVLQRSGECAGLFNSAESDLESLRSEAATDDVECVLDDKRKPDTTLSKRIAAAEKLLNELEKQSNAIDGALKRQQAKVDELETEISNRKLEAFRLELGTLPNELKELMGQLAQKAAAIESITRKHNRHPVELSAELFPVNPADPYAGMQERSTGVALVNAALHYFASTITGRKAA